MSFHKRITAEADAARARIKARSERRKQELKHFAPEARDGVEPYELAMQVGKIVADEFAPLDVFTPEELENYVLELGWIVADEFRANVSEEIAELVLVHIRSKCKESVERLLAEEE